MAINPNEITFEGTTGKGKVTWPRGLLIFMIFFFIAIVGSIFVLNYFINSAHINLSEVEKEVESAKMVFPAESQQVMNNFKNQSYNLQKLLQNHTFFSKALQNISQQTHPQITFTSLGLDYNDLTVEINGIASSYDSVAQGVLLFSQIFNVVKADIKSLKSLSDGVHFSISLEVYPDFFK